MELTNEANEKTGYRIVEGREHIRLEDVMRLLQTTYWANGRGEKQVSLSLDNSVCYGMYREDALIGFARVITDFATTFYLADVVIDPAYRRTGLGTELLTFIMSRPAYRGLRGILTTRDAHGFYERFGFETERERVMLKAQDPSVWDE